MPGPHATSRFAPGGAADLAARSVLWWLLAAWLGSWLCFALVIAPNAFQVLPSPELAGRLVSPVLRTLHWLGAAAGVGLALLAWLLGRGRLLIWLPLVLAAGCVASELGITPQLAAIRDHAFGPDGRVEAVVRYRRLHGLSMVVFSAVLVGVLALVPLHVRRASIQGGDSA